MIRDATHEDIAAIAQIHRAARAVAMPWLPVLHTPAEDLWFFTNHVFGKETLLVFARDDHVLGFAAGAQGWLNHLYVHPDQQGQGVGRSLLDQAQVAQDVLQLWTFLRNTAARRFYASAGFIEVEPTDGTHNEELTPDVRLEWRRHKGASLS